MVGGCYGQVNTPVFRRPLPKRSRSARLLVCDWILILDAWRQKRKARLRREWSRRQYFYSARRTTPLRAFFKRFRKTLAILLAIASIRHVALFAARKNINARAKNAADNSVAAYATNFRGDATGPLPAGETQHPGIGDINRSWN